MHIEQISAANWNDFVSLMRADAQCSECWCLNHRAPAGCATGAAAQEQMKQLTDQKKVGGLLAYNGAECVGWISIDPMTAMVGHDCQSSAKPDEWAIHCIFVKDGFRGQGISTKLIQASVGFAKENGARLVSAFPIPEQNRSKFPPNEAEFSGRYSTYSKLGFKPAGEESEFYQRMELSGL